MEKKKRKNKSLPNKKSLHNKKAKQYNSDFHELLKDKNFLFQSILKLANDFIFIIDTEGYVRFVNKFGARYLGSTPKQIIGKQQKKFFPPKTAKLQQQMREKVIRSGKPLENENMISFYKKDL
ncbi:MAG: PAS domain-containing protein, partial [Nanoarchaeota archaeon]|nr:PAS domain-containing protein [Nanoarchaeota archaeon]